LPTALTVSQIIALRFASDEEWLSLIQKAINENLSSKEIKQLIKSWRGDYYRV
jgi:ABC-type amino acid transport substrate-binding protein